MPETPWTSPFNITPEPEKDYIAVITYLPINSYFKFPAFFKHVSAIQKQLNNSYGLLAFKLRADILARKAYTLSIWEDAKSLRNFITSGPHGELMNQAPGYLGNDRKFVTVVIKGSEFPPSWAWAMETLRKN